MDKSGSREIDSFAEQLCIGVVADIRDQLAMAAMTGWIVHSDRGRKDWYREAARDAYRLADAMLEARDEAPEK